MSEAGQHLILYDGQCGLCARVTRFVLPRDRAGVFRFCALQHPLAKELLARYGRDATALDTFYVVENFGREGERLRDRSEGALFIAQTLGGGWRLVAAARLLPRGVRDLAYDFVANNRLRWFGGAESCALPTPEYRARFLDALGGAAVRASSPSRS